MDINDIDYSDPLVFACFGKGYLRDSSLFSRYGLDNYVLEKLLYSMDDLIACISLEPDRVNAWANNEKVEQYVTACAANKESIINSPIFKEITKNTHGLLIYQEQIIRIFEDIGGFSPEQANEARQALGKVSKIEDYRIIFIHGCKEKGIPGCLALGLTEDVGEEIYTVTSNMARYCFNKSHAVAMAKLIYLFVWLKYYYPDDVKSALECKK